MSWTPIDDELLRDLLEAKAAAGEPWCEHWMVADLRWWAGQVRKREATGNRRLPARVPSYRKLAERWNVSPHRARTVLQSGWRVVKVEEAPRTERAPAAQESRTVRAVGTMDTALSHKKSRKVRAPATQESRKNHDTRVPTEDRTQKTTPEETPSGSPPKSPPQGGPKLPSAPRWASKARTPKRIRPQMLALAVLRAAAAGSGRPLPPEWAGSWKHPTLDSDAAPIQPEARTTVAPLLALLRALDWPSLPGWLEQFELIAAAARWCPEPVFAHDLRGEGWANGDGVDRSASIPTLCVQKRWDERLIAAQAWDRAGRPRAATTNHTPSKATRSDDLSVFDELGGGESAAPIRRSA